MRTEYEHLSIGSRWLPAGTDERTTVVSPHSGRPIGSTPCATERDVDRASAKASDAFDDSPWPNLAPEKPATSLEYKSMDGA